MLRSSIRSKGDFVVSQKAGVAQGLWNRRAAGYQEKKPARIA